MGGGEEGNRVTLSDEHLSILMSTKNMRAIFIRKIAFSFKEVIFIIIK